MTLEEQYKESKNRLPRSVLCQCYTDSYVEWLKEKLTWKKFGEQKPDSGKKAFIRNGDQIDYVVFKSKKSINKTELLFPEGEWMYVPE